MQKFLCVYYYERNKIAIACVFGNYKARFSTNSNKFERSAFSTIQNERQLTSVSQSMVKENQNFSKAANRVQMSHQTEMQHNDRPIFHVLVPKPVLRLGDHVTILV